MEKGKQLFLNLGSVFAFCMLALVILLPGAKANAALAVDKIDYENSTITISTTSNDSVLYFSDKNKKKWEMAINCFESGKCTMDISWVSTTKNYEITFKGDKSNTTEDILSVILPKQVTNFKAKYNQATGEVTFTGAPADRIIEYRKNNTNSWKSFGTANTSQSALKESLRRLCENGASVYFRLQSEDGTSATATGQRSSKEVACKISKKTAAPTVTIDGSSATISVQSGWQVRKVDVEERSGVQYVTDYVSVNSEADSVEGNWYTFPSARKVPLTEIAPSAMYEEGKETEDVYLQFRKGATSSSQVSYMTTVKVPKQEEPPKIAGDDISIEYTSSSTFKLAIGSATSTNVYEYCVLDSTEFKNNEITDLESVTWNTINSASGVSIKKADAPDGGSIFIRKKSIGKSGDDDFKLATGYIKCFDKLQYPTDASGAMEKAEFSRIDGVYTEDPISFTIRSQYNTKVSTIKLSTLADQTGGDMTATIGTSKVVKDDSAKDKYKYIITTTITDITLDTAAKEKLENNETITLYGYILLNVDDAEKDAIKSNNTEGLIIRISPKSSIVTDLDSSDKKNQVKVERIVGVTDAAISTEIYDSFWFNIKQGDSTAEISKVQLGNYQLVAGTDYTYKEGKFTAMLSNFEKKDALVSSYGKEQNLIITLSNNEVLQDVKVKLIAPVSLKRTYAWVFAAKSLETSTTKITTSTNGEVSKEEIPVDSYSVNYSIASGIGIESIELQSAMLGTTNIMKSFDSSKDEIVFRNSVLNELNPMSSTPVKMTFTIHYSNNSTSIYTIEKGCSFAIV